MNTTNTNVQSLVERMKERARSQMVKVHADIQCNEIDQLAALAQTGGEAVRLFERARFGVFHEDGRFEELLADDPVGMAHPRAHTSRWVGGTADSQVLRAFLIEAAPTPTEAPQADVELLGVIAALGAALRKLSFCAQTTGGVAGPDADLQEAIGNAEKALSLAGIAHAMEVQATQAQAAEPDERLADRLQAWLSTIEQAHDESLDGGHAAARSMLRELAEEMRAYQDAPPQASQKAAEVGGSRPLPVGGAPDSLPWKLALLAQEMDLSDEYRLTCQLAANALAMDQPVGLHQERKPLTEGRLLEMIGASEVFEYHPGSIMELMREVERAHGIVSKEGDHV